MCRVYRRSFFNFAIIQFHPSDNGEIKWYRDVFSASVGVSMILFLLTGACATTGGSTFKSPQEWIANSKTGPHLPLADKADAWSDGKVFNSPSGQLEVKSKFLKQHGTTCHFDIQFTNVGKAASYDQVTLGSENTAEVYGHRLTAVKLQPGKSGVWEIEKRECGLKWGESKEMQICAKCKPLVVFLKN